MAAGCLLLVTAACRRETPPASSTPVAASPRPLVGAFEEIALPAGDGAGQPFVSASSSGGALVSWLEPVDGGGHSLKFARVDGVTPPVARVIATRDDFFVNFADFPSIVDAGGVLFAHWLQKRGLARTPTTSGSPRRAMAG